MNIIFGNLFGGQGYGEGYAKMVLGDWGWISSN